MNEPHEKKSWLGRLKDGLKKSSEKLTQGVTEIFTHKKLDATMLLRDRDDSKGPEQSVTLKDLVPMVQQKQTGNPDRPVVIAADKEVRYEAVLKVMDELHRANIRRVGLAVKAAGS